MKEVLSGAPKCIASNNRDATVMNANIHNLSSRRRVERLNCMLIPYVSHKRLILPASTMNA